MYFQDISELMKISDDVDLKVKITYTLTNSEVKHTRYQSIQIFIKNGVDIAGDVRSVHAQVKAVIRSNKHLLESVDEKPFFKSEEFFVKENVKCKDNTGVFVTLQELQEFSGNKIRFDANQTLEV